MPQAFTGQGCLRDQAKRLGLAGLIVHEGLFADMFITLSKRSDLKFAFVHVDAKTYDSTLEACRFAMPRAASGCLVVFDDSNGVLDLGARLPIDQSLADSGVTPTPLVWSSAYVRMPGGGRSVS